MASKNEKINKLEAERVEKQKKLDEKLALLNEMNAKKAEAETAQKIKNPEPLNEEDKGIPLFVSKDTKQQLFDLRYSKEDIALMNGEQAQKIVNNLIIKKTNLDATTKTQSKTEDKKDLATLKLESKNIEDKKVKSLREKIFGFFNGKEKKESPHEEEIIRDMHLQRIEESRKKELENGPLSARIKNGVLKGINAWEKFGIEEKDQEGKVIKKGSFWKRMTKMGVNMALISLISMGAVEKLAQNNIGTATALTSTSFAKRMSFGLGVGTLIEGGGKISPKLKKWIPLAITGIGIGAAFALTGGGAGAVAIGSSALGFAATKFKGIYTEEKILKKENAAKNAFQKKFLSKDGKIDTSRISEVEKEYEKILKKYENMRIWGKLLNEGTKVLTGSAVAFGALEASGAITDHNRQVVLEEQHKVDEAAAERKTEVDTRANDVLKARSEFEKLRHEEFKTVVIDKGGSNERSFIHQIESNQEKAIKLGYNGDWNDKKALHEFAGIKADQIARDTGIVGENGEQERMGELAIGKIAPIIRIENNGDITIEDTDINGKVLEVHHSGDRFSENINKEYEYNYKNETEPVNEDVKVTIVPEDPNKNIEVTDLKHEDTPLTTQDQNLMKLRDEDKPFVDDNKNSTVVTEKVEPEKTSEPLKETSKPKVEPEYKIYDPKNDLGNQTDRDGEPSTEPIHNKNEPITESDLKGTLERMYTQDNLSTVPKAIYHDNLNHIFGTPGEAKHDYSLNTYSKVENNPANNFLEIKPNGKWAPAYRELHSYVHKLEEVSGLKPIPQTDTHHAETINQFIVRAIEKIEQTNNLDKIKL